MKPIRRYLDEAIDAGVFKNDSDIARQLGVHRSAVSQWRVGATAPNEDQAAALADLLGKPEVMAECMAARAKRPETRAMWERAAKTLSMAASFAALAVANLLFAPSPANAAPTLESSAMTICIMSTWRRATRWLARLAASAPRLRLS